MKTVSINSFFGIIGATKGLLARFFAFFLFVGLFASVAHSQSHELSYMVNVDLEGCSEDYGDEEDYELELDIYEQGGGRVGYAFLTPGPGDCDGDWDRIQMKPGVEYDFDTYDVWDTMDWSRIKITISAPDGWVFQIRKSGEMVERKTYTGGSGFIARLVPASDESLGRPAGESSSLSDEEIMWSVGLGSLVNGRSAGVLQLRYSSMSSLTYEPADLFFSVENSEIDYYAPSGVLRQIFAPQALADIIDTGTDKYEIRFYDWTDVGSKVGNLYTLSGSPFVTYELSKSGTNQLRIKKASGTGTWYTRLTYSGSTWTMYDWTETGSETTQSLRKATTSVSTSGAYTYSHTTEYGRPDSTSSFTSSSSTRYTQQTFAWGKELIKEERGYGQSYVQITSYEYFTSTVTGQGRMGQLKKVTRPDGGYTRYTYYTSGDKRGKPYEVFEPFEDVNEGRKTAYTYVTHPSISGGTLYIRDVVTRYVLNGSYQQVGKATYTHTGETWNGTTAIKTVRRDFYGTGASDYLETTNRTYSKDVTGGDYYRKGMPLSVRRPDGTQTSYVYQPFGSVYDFESFEGTSASSGESSQYYTTYFAGAEDIDNIYMVAKKSVKSQRNINAGGKTYASYESVQVTPNGGFEIMAETTYAYESGGRLNLSKRQSWANNAATGSWNTLYEANFDGIELTSTTDAAGVKKSFAYDKQGRVDVFEEEGVSDIVYNDIESLFTSFVYDGTNRIIQSERSGETDTEMVVSTWAYDQAGRMKSKSMDCCNTVTYTYPASDQIKATNPDGGYTQEYFYRDGTLEKRLGTATTPLYVKSRESGGSMETWSAAKAFSVGSFELDGRMKSLDHLGRIEHTRVPAPTGSRYEVFEYDNTKGGRLVAKRARTSETSGDLLSPYRYLYDALGQVEYEGFDTVGGTGLVAGSGDRAVRHVNEFWESTSNYWYSSNTEYVYPGATQIKTRNTIVRVGPASGYLNEVWTSDGVGNYASTYQSVNRTTGVVTVRSNPVPAPTNDAISLYKNGLLVKHTDHAGVVTEIEYDHLRRESRVDGRDSVSTVTAYISGSYRPQYIKQDDGSTEHVIRQYAYDSNNRVSMDMGENGSADEYAYYKYNGRGQVTEVYGDGAYPIDYAYDDYGRMTEQIQYRKDDETLKSRVGFVYNDADYTGLLGEKKHYTVYSGSYKSEKYVYDSLRRLSIRKRHGDMSPSSDRVTYVYSSSTGELTSETPSIGESASYTYDSMGRLKTVNDHAGLRTFDYSSNSGLSLKEEILPSFYAQDLDFAYHSTSTNDHVRGSLKSYSYGSGGTIATWEYTRDKAKGRLSSVGATADGLGKKTFNITYDADSNHVTKVQYGAYSTERLWSSWRELRTESKTMWSYGSTTKARFFANSSGFTEIDRQGQYEKYTLDNTGAGSLHDMYTNASGDIAYSFGYDKRGQLTSYDRNDGNDYDVTSYQYDSAGNVTKFDYAAKPDVTYGAYNEANQSTSNGLGYDDDGNLDADADWTYGYDSFNRLISMEGKTGNNKDLYFYYDFMGRRIEKKVYVNESLSETVKFLYDGMTLIAELDGSGAVQKSFHWGPDKSDVIGGAGGAEGLAYMRDWTTNANLYPSYDLSGNLVGLMDGGSTYVAWYSYDPNGNVVDSGGSYADENPIGFSTQYTDRESGLVYYGLRYYSPERARFLNRDPIAEAGGANLYRFVGNNPVSRVDVWGLCEEPPDPHDEYDDIDDEDFNFDDYQSAWFQYQRDLDRYNNCLEWERSTGGKGSERTGSGGWTIRPKGSREIKPTAYFDAEEARSGELGSAHNKGLVGYYATEELSRDQLSDIDRTAISATNGIFNGTLNVSHLKYNGRSVNPEMLRHLAGMNEFGGAIYSYKGQIYLSNTVLGGPDGVAPSSILSQGNFVSASGKQLGVGSYTVLGIWHTHPGNGPSSGPKGGGYPFGGDVGYVRKSGMTVYTGRRFNFVDRVNPSGDHTVTNIANEGRGFWDDRFNRP